MSTRSRGVRYIMAVALVVCSVSLALAQPSGEEPGKKWGAWKEKSEAIYKDLNLTPEQQQKIAEQRKQEKEQAQALQQKIAATRSQLHQALEQASPDKAKVYSLLAEMKELTGKRMEQRVERIFALQEVLTPEQFKMLQEKTKERASEFKSKKEGRREKGIGDGACRRKFGHWDSSV